MGQEVDDFLPDAGQVNVAPQRAWARSQPAEWRVLKTFLALVPIGCLAGCVSMAINAATHPSARPVSVEQKNDAMAALNDSAYNLYIFKDTTVPLEGGIHIKVDDQELAPLHDGQFTALALKTGSHHLELSKGSHLGSILLVPGAARQNLGFDIQVKDKEKSYIKIDTIKTIESSYPEMTINVKFSANAVNETTAKINIQRCCAFIHGKI